jgi:hypothetical protein
VFSIKKTYNLYLYIHQRGRRGRDCMGGLIVPCVKLSCHDNQFDCFLKPVENNQRNIIAMSRLKADSKNMFFFLISAILRMNC